MEELAVRLKILCDELIPSDMRDQARMTEIDADPSKTHGAPGRLSRHARQSVGGLISCILIDDTQNRTRLKIKYVLQHCVIEVSVLPQ